MAEILQSLNPEQLYALSPECLKVILKNGSIPTIKELNKLTSRQINALTDENLIPQQIKEQLYEQDLPELKRWVKKDEPFMVYAYGEQTHGYRTTMIHNLLVKYDDIPFYLTYTNVNKSYDPVKYELHDENEIKQLLPTGVDLDQICFSNGEKPFDVGGYPNDYVHDKSYKLLGNLAFIHNNLNFVHPIMLNCAKHFIK